MVPSYFALVGRSSTEHMSSSASKRVSVLLSRISNRSTRRAGGILSDMATSAVAGASKPAALPSGGAQKIDLSLCSLLFDAIFVMQSTENRR